MLRYRQCAMSRAFGLAPSYKRRGPSFPSLLGQIHVRVEHADSRVVQHTSAPPLGKKPNDSADKDAPACPLCSLLSAKVPGLVVARANHPLTSCWMAREAERYFRSDRPHRSGKQQQHQQQQQQQSLDVSATALRRPTSAQQQQAHGRRTVVADAVVASGSARSTLTTLSRSRRIRPAPLGG
jgi:hypothetical protein